MFFIDIFAVIILIFQLSLVWAKMLMEEIRQIERSLFLIRDKKFYNTFGFKIFQ